MELKVCTRSAENVFGAPFFLDAAAFASLPMEAVEGRGQALRAGGGFQEIAGQLLGEEFVVGKIPVEGVHHPIAIRPGRAELIALITVAVGVTSGTSSHGAAMRWPKCGEARSRSTTLS